MRAHLPPLVVMGVSGCGKSTVGALLGQRLLMPFFDGDDFHPAANKQKMTAGVPLTDSDREPWLARLGELLAGKDDGGVGVPPIVACSALKRRYRDLLRSYAPDIVFVHLAGTAATIGARMDARSHEFMPRTLLDSQFAALEDLKADETHVLGDITQPLDLLVESLELKLKHAAARDASDAGVNVVKAAGDVLGDRCFPASGEGRCGAQPLC
ncbi:gluconokinase [Arthrobacter bambusae]|uniref:gluconokinase n=1 Tax=Arthrobacter bambusae TaxID=1338426 RepID=UPI00278685FC|nr:gluconokinase [Arthrobacter bambusae]MDQ0031694.1 gluconokinase [Arthrobacter bambusae]MDQ0098765.1 gluconokinase [Arthrobacter bambusae]